MDMDILPEVENGAKHSNFTAPQNYFPAFSIFCFQFLSTRNRIENQNWRERERVPSTLLGSGLIGWVILVLVLRCKGDIDAGR